MFLQNRIAHASQENHSHRRRARQTHPRDRARAWDEWNDPKDFERAFEKIAKRQAGPERDRTRRGGLTDGNPSAVPTRQFPLRVRHQPPPGLNRTVTAMSKVARWPEANEGHGGNARYSRGPVK